MMSRASTLQNLLFYVQSLYLIDQSQTFSMARCPIYAGMFLFCAGSRSKKVNKRLEQWVSKPLPPINYDLKYQMFLSAISINLLVVYRESMNLIGYITHRLSADSQQNSQ